MQRHRFARSILMLTLAVICFTSPVVAERWAEAKGTWDQAIYDNNGRLLAANGRESAGEPIALSVSTESRGDRLVTRTTYQKGKQSLTIQRSFEGTMGLDTLYETDRERILVSISYDDLTKDSLVVYRMPDGEVFSLWIAENGDLLSGDVKGLRKALRQPMEITRLLESYVLNRDEFKNDLPSAGEAFLMPMVTCEDSCAMGCPLQCALECAFGMIPCRICNVACGIGCIIGCSR